MSFDVRRGRGGTRARVARFRPSRFRRATTPLLLGAALAALLAGCTTGNPQSTLDPVGPHAQAILNLLTPVFWAAVAVFVFVEGLLVYSVWRWRSRPGDALPPQIHGNTPLEITWTIVPAVILLGILGLTFNTQRTLSAPPPGGINVRVVGHQWWWEFQYPDLGITTADEIHMPVGVPVYLTIESNDVIHSFWLPRLGGKTDAIPGRINHQWLQGDAVGTFEGQCAEFCGIEHALMRVMAVVQTQSDFDSWARNERSIPGFGATPVPTSQAGSTTGSLVSQGMQLVANGACASCHTIRGTNAQGKVGPDLTHFASRASIAGNTLPNTPENLRKWVHNTQAIKPGVVMPAFTSLSDADLDAIVAYLETLK